MSETKQNLTPAVDVEFLAECMGLKAWPESAFPQTTNQRMAIRVITDAFRMDSTTKEIKPETSLSNATVWIEQAYGNGVAAGVRMERERWERKILELFGIRVSQA